MSDVSASSPRFASGDLSAFRAKPSEQIRRRSHRLSITNWRANSIGDKSITHVDVFLGSLTAVSEHLASSLTDKIRELGAKAILQPLEAFQPQRYTDPNSTYRSPTRLVVFVVSTHVAGKPSPNAETFLQWLHDTPTAVRPSTARQTAEVQESVEAKPIEARAPRQINSDETKIQSPRTHRIQSEGELQRHNSLTDALRVSFRVNWRNPFSGGDAETKPDGSLNGVQFAVFGVGNSIYRTYNATAKYVDSRLHELGALRVCPVGLGDVSKGIEAVFAKWEAQLLQTISCQPVTAREPSSPPPRVSLPSPTVAQGFRVADTIAGQAAVQGSISTSLKLPLPEMPRPQGHESYQRRYSSASVVLSTQQKAFDPNFSMPPLTDRT